MYVKDLELLDEVTTKMNDRLSLPLRSELFCVKVPAVALLSEEELEIFGAPTVYVNNRATNIVEYNTVYLNLVQLLDIYESGMEIYLLEDTDVNKVYETIDTYLRNVVDEVGVTIHTKKIDQTLAMRLEPFAAKIFNLNIGTLVSKMREEVNGFIVTGTADLNLIDSPATDFGYGGIVREDVITVSGGGKFSDNTTVDDLMKIDLSNF